MNRAGISANTAAIASIMLVDDDEPLRRSLTILLEQRGYEVAAYANPIEAVDAVAASRRRFDLVITDVRMPNMDGIHFLGIYRRAFPAVPVIVMTAFAGDLVRENETPEGAFAFLSKPLDVEQFLGVVRHAISDAALWENPLVSVRSRGGR